MFLLHGGPAAIGSIGPLAELLCTSSRLHCGVAEPFQSKDTIDGLLAELHEQMTSTLAGYGADASTTIAGHSWGAWLAAIYASRHPEHVHTLVLIGCPPLEQRYAAQINSRRMDNLKCDEREQFRNLIGKIEANTLTDKDLAELRRLTTIADNVDAEPFDCKYQPDRRIYAKVWSEAELMRRNGSLLAAFRKIANRRISVTIIHGDRDPHPVEGVAEPLDGIGLRYTLYRIADCGHNPFLERHCKAQVIDAIVESFDNIR